MQKSKERTFVKVHQYDENKCVNDIDSTRLLISVPIRNSQTAKLADNKTFETSKGRSRKLRRIGETSSPEDSGHPRKWPPQLHR